MRFDLCRVWVPLDSKLLHEALRYLNPILLWEGYFVSVQVSSSSIKLALGDDPLQVLDLQLQSVSVVGDFFTHG